jgi:hypothetical protein
MKEKLPKPKVFQLNHAAASGICYTGVAAALANSHGEFVVVAANEAMLISAWKSMAAMTMNPEEMKRVAIFRREDTAIDPAGHE